MKLSHYAFNLLTWLGSPLKLYLGSEQSARMQLPWLVLDQRDGFEVAFFSCESSTVPAASPQAPASSTP